MCHFSTTWRHPKLRVENADRKFKDQGTAICPRRIDIAEFGLGVQCYRLAVPSGYIFQWNVISREKRRKVDTASEGGVDEGSDDNDGGRGSDDSSSDESKSSDRDEFPQEQADEAQHEQPEYIAQETDEVPEATSSVVVIAEDDMAEDDMPRRELLEPAAGGKEKAPEKATKQLMLSDMFRKPSK